MDRKEIELEIYEECFELEYIWNSIHVFTNYILTKGAIKKEFLKYTFLKNKWKYIYVAVKIYIQACLKTK